MYTLKEFVSRAYYSLELKYENCKDQFEYGLLWPEFIAIKLFLLFN